MLNILGFKVIIFSKFTTMFINCKTYFSFRYGTMSHKDLVRAAINNGVQSLALTNINSTCDIWDFVQRCNEENTKPIAGVENRNGDKMLYLLLAANNNGFWMDTRIPFKPFS